MHFHLKYRITNNELKKFDQKNMKKVSFFFVKKGFGGFCIDKGWRLHCLCYFLNRSHFPFVYFLNPFPDEPILFGLPQSSPFEARFDVLQRNILGDELNCELKQASLCNILETSFRVHFEHLTQKLKLSCFITSIVELF